MQFLIEKQSFEAVFAFFCPELYKMRKKPFYPPFNFCINLSADIDINLESYIQIEYNNNNSGEKCVCHRLKNPA